MVVAGVWVQLKGCKGLGDTFPAVSAVSRFHLTHQTRWRCHLAPFILCGPTKKNQGSADFASSIWIYLEHLLRGYPVWDSKFDARAPSANQTWKTPLMPHQEGGMGGVPSGYVKIAIENGHINSGFTP